jgi:biotin carboxyl carrier protein
LGGEELDAEFNYRYGDEEHTIRLEPRPTALTSPKSASGPTLSRYSGQKAGRSRCVLAASVFYAYTAACEICKTGVSLRYVAPRGSRGKVFELERFVTRGGGAAARQPRSLEAQMPGQVMEVLVKEGDSVQAGQP